METWKERKYAFVTQHLQPLKKDENKWWNTSNKRTCDWDWDLKFDEKLPIFVLAVSCFCNYFPGFSHKLDESEEGFIFQLFKKKKLIQPLIKYLQYEAHFKELIEKKRNKEKRLKENWGSWNMS